MIDGSEKRKRQLAFELQNSHVCEKRSKDCHAYATLARFFPPNKTKAKKTAGVETKKRRPNGHPVFLSFQRYGSLETAVVSKYFLKFMLPLVNRLI